MPGPGTKTDLATPRQRLDKYLMIARFFKSRDLAAEVLTGGHCRINGQRCRKPGHAVTLGDVLTFVQEDRVRVIRILALGDRRGPATLAQELYVDLEPINLDHRLE